MRTPERALFALSLVLALAACRAEPPGEGGAAASAAPPSERGYRPAARTTDWSRIELVPVTFDEWQKELEAFRGTIVVVDLWATWCAPCLERFPAMVEMARRWEPEGVTFVSLSLDDRDDPETMEQVRGFLESQNARMPNYLMNEIIPDAFDKLGLLGIPAVYVYDPAGNRTHRLTGDDPNRQFTEADVEAAVRELVARRG